MDSYENTSEFSVNGKKFDRKSIDISFESRRFSVEPLLKISFERSHRVSFFAEAGWAFALKKWDGIYLKENKGPLFGKKRVFLRPSDPGLSFSGEGDMAGKVRINPFITVNVGIILHL